MPFTYKDVQEIENQLYGENAELSSIHHLYARVALHTKVQQRGWMYPELLSRIPSFELLVADLDKISEKLEEEIDKEMTAPDSINYNKYLAMKGYTYFFRGLKKNPNNRQNVYQLNFLERCVNLLEPIRSQKEAVYLYVLTLNHLGCYYIQRLQNHKAIEYFKKIEQAYEEFKAKVKDVLKDAMSECILFDALKVEPEHDTVNCLPNIYNCALTFLYICYRAFDNKDMILKYLMPSLKGILVNSIVFSMDEKLQLEELVSGFDHPIVTLIKAHRFCQVNHLLSVFMFQLVKRRRSLPSLLQQEVIYAQAIVSLWYATWAFEIISYSCQSLTDKTFAEKHQIIDEVDRLDVLIEPGVEIYENQFPCEPIVTYKELKKAVKKGQAWCKRAIDCFEGPDPAAKVILEQLTACEKKVEEFADLN